MARLTKFLDNGSYSVDNDKISQNENGFSGEAINKLAKIENICERLPIEQIELSKELEKLRNEDKKNSYKFRELMGKKLVNTEIITLLKNNGLM